MMPLVKTVEIAKNVFMPIIGVGTWQMTDSKVLHDVLDSAFKSGYRFIDTAAVYGNEEVIGEYLQELLPKYNLKREDIFITSKLPTYCQGKGKARQECLKSLQRLRITYLDLYLIHFPGAQGVDSKDGAKLKELRHGSWLELESLQKEGKIRAIGVSNYMVHHLEELFSYSLIKPAVNQCEYHPHNVCSKLVEFCNRNQIHFQAYSSLGTRDCKEKLFNEKLIEELCTKYQCDNAQLLLAWAINQGISVLPKTCNPNHVMSNLKAAEIILNQSDVEKIKNLNSNLHYCWNPNNVA